MDIIGSQSSCWTVVRVFEALEDTVSRTGLGTSIHSISTLNIVRLTLMRPQLCPRPLSLFGLFGGVTSSYNIIIQNVYPGRVSVFEALSNS